MQLYETEKNPKPAGAHVGRIETPDGVFLRYARWKSVKRPSRGTVILLTGRTEFIEKYYETIFELRDRGLGVLAFDWRGQGASSRLLDNPKKGYVEDFDEYAIDFNAILEQIALPDCTPPYFVLGHSTGSLVALLATPAEKNRIQRMVLTSPLLALDSLPFNQTTLKYMCGAAMAVGLGESYIEQGQETMENRPFGSNRLTSDSERFQRNREFAVAWPDLVVGGATITWIYAACKAMDRLEDPDLRVKLTVPTLLIGAGGDQVVSCRAAEELGASVHAASCLVIDGAKHEQFQERDIYREQMWAAFDAFIPGNQ